MKWTVRVRQWNHQNLWRAILKAGVIGGASCGMLFAIVCFFPPSVATFLSQPNSAESVVLLSVFALIIGGLFGCAAGLGASLGGILLHQIAFVVTHSRLLQSIAVAVGAALGTIPGSVYLIAPLLAGVFGSQVWGSVWIVIAIATIAGLILGAITFFNEGNSTVARAAESS